VSLLYGKVAIKTQRVCVGCVVC